MFRRTRPSDGSPVPTWVIDFYRECGREISLSFTTLHNLESVRVAILVASAGFLGVTIGTNGRPTVTLLTSLFVLVVIWLANVRLLVRSCLIYGNLLRFNHLQQLIVAWSASDGAGSNERSTFIGALNSYYRDQRSLQSKWCTLRENLKLGGGYYLFGLVGIAICYRAWEIRSCGRAEALAIFVASATVLETILFMRTSALRRQSDRVPRKRGRVLYWLVVGVALAGISEVLTNNPFGGTC